MGGEVKLGEVIRGPKAGSFCWIQRENETDETDHFLPLITDYWCLANLITRQKPGSEPGTEGRQRMEEDET